MKKPIRILIIEATEPDADLATRLIRRELGNCEFQIVATRRDFLKALETFQPDLIVSNYHLPDFDGMQALKLALKHIPLIPFIIWTHSCNEETAVNCLKAGASNYILRENSEQLGQAVRQAFRERQSGLLRRQAEEKYQHIFENSVDGIFQSTPDGRYLYVNTAMAQLYGYDSAQEMIDAVQDIAHQIYTEPEQRAGFVQRLESHGMIENYEQQNYRKDGSIIWTSTSVCAVRAAKGEVLHYEGVIRNITERKQMEARLRESEEKYRTLAEHLPAITYISKPDQFVGVTYISPQIESLGFSQSEWLADPDLWLRQIHPEDRERVLRELETFQTGGETFSVIYRLRLRNGDARWFHDKSSYVRDQDGKPILKQGFMLDITHYKQAEQALRENQIKYQNLVETSHDLIWSIDAEGRFTFVNRAAREIYGFEPEELIGRSFFEVMDPHYYSLEQSMFTDAVAGVHELKEVETHIRHRDGRQRILSTNLIVIRGQEGKIVSIMGSSRDITERKRAEMERQAHFEIMQGLANTKDLQELLKRIHRSIAQVIYAENFFVVLYQPESGLFEEIYSVDQYDRPASPAKLENSITSYIFHTGEPLMLTEAHFNQLATQGNVTLVGINSKSWLGVPLKTSGRTIGVMAVQDYEKDDRYTEGDKNFLASIAPQIALAMERKRTEEALRESEEHYRAIFEGVQDAIFVESVDGRILMVNEPACEMFGYTRAEFLSKTVADLVPEGSLIVMADGSDSGLSAEPRETFNRRANGEVFPIEISGRLQVIHGQPVLLVVVREITERKRTEAHINDLLALNEKILNYSPLGVITYKFTGECVFANEKAASIIGAQVDTLKAQNFRNIESWRKSGLYALVEKAIQSQSPVTADIHHISTFGKDVWIMAHCITFQSKGEEHVLLSIADITERKQTEEALRKAEIKYRMLVERLPVVIYTAELGMDGAWSYVSPQIEELLGFTPEEWMADPGLWYRQIHPDDQPLQQALEQQTYRPGDPVVSEYRIFARDGRQLWIQDSAQVLPASGDGTSVVQGVWIDLTERKQAEDELRRQTEARIALYETTHDLVMERDSSKLLRIIVERAARLLNAEAGGLYLCEPDRNQVHCVVSYNTAIDLTGTTLQYGEGAAGLVAQTGEPLIVDDYRTWQGRAPTYDENTFFRAVLSVPIKWQDQVVGVLHALDEGGERRFHQDDLNLIMSFANQAAIAIQNARLYTLAQQELAERRRAEEALRESEERFSNAFEYAPIGKALVSPDGKLLKVNRAMCAMVGYSSEELQQKDFQSLTHPDDLETDLHLLRQMLAGQIDTFQIEKRYLHKLGYPIWTLLSVSLVRDHQGTPLYFISQIQDITERKRTEDELRFEKERFERIAAAAPGIIGSIRLRPDGSACMPFASTAIQDVYGFLPTDLERDITPFLTRVHPDDLAQTNESLRESARTMLPWHNEFRYLHPSKGEVWIEGQSMPVREPDGSIIWHGFISDITERKRAEAELRGSEERFRQLADNIQEVFWMTDAISGKELYMSRAAELIWERPVEYLMQEPNAFINSVFPEDQPAILRAMEKERNGEKVEIEYRIVRPNGSLRWVWARAFPIYDETSRVVRIAGISADITERRESEMALVKSQSRYRELFDNSPISIWEEDYSLVKKRLDAIQASGVIDPVEYLFLHPEEIAELASLVRVMDANKAALQLYHLEHKDILPRGLNQMLSEDALGHFREELLGFLSTSKRFVWEGTDRMLNGTQIEVLVTGSIPDAYAEDWSKVIVSVHDMTESKRAEQEIRRRVKETSALLETSLALTTLDLQVTLQTIGSSAKTLFVADGCRIFLMGTDGESLRCVLALQENFAAFSDLRIKVGEGVTGAVAASGRAEIVNEMQNDLRAVDVPGTPENEAEAIMFAPLKERDRTIGVLSIRRAGAGRPFEPVDLELLEAFASMAASAVSNARLFEETQRRLTELEALYENGLAVGRLLEPTEIGNKLIETFARYLRWHHVTIRLRREDSESLDLVAFNLPSLQAGEMGDAAKHFITRINKVGQGLSGWVIQTGTPVRTGDVHAYPQYIDMHAGVQSGLYMPLKIGERVIGVISVESELSDAFTEQDERLLATLASQAAIAFENARLYEAIQKELLERKRAEEALRTSETHYRELADSITDILFELDQDLRCIHWNKASETLLGIPAAEAVGKSMHEIFGDSAAQTRIRHIYESVLANRQRRTFETTMILSGQPRSLEINAYPSTRGVSVVAKDVTDRKRSEIIMQKRFELMEYSAHQSLNELMQRTVDEVSELTGSTIGFFHFVEADQNRLAMQTWSTNALRLFNVPVEAGAHLPLDQAGVWADAVRQRRPLIHNNYEVLSKKRGLPPGHEPIVREIVIPIIRNERIMAVMGIGNKPQEYTQHDLEIAERLADYAWDITERKQMELALEMERNQLAQRVEERTADLSRANAHLARALRVKDEFLANMSHELRTPLNAILGLSESLGEQIAGPLNEKQQKYITTISESGHHLLALINDILDLAKIEAGQITLDINKVDIHSVCQASLRMIRQLAQKKNQDVVLHIEDGLGLLWADERRLKQMIVNLLGNAVKFTPEHGRIGLEVDGDEDANKITFTVWDNGIGIDQGSLKRLFQPFVQLDSGLAREATGTGLGLALVAQMARLHGGSVHVESEPGKGSRFSIVLPWEPALAMDAATRLRITGKFRAIKPDELNKPVILLVEDTQEVVMMIRDYLELAGYKVVTAQDGVDAIVQAKLTHPNLILMDVQMPRMDGLEATRKLRSEPEFKHTPIIALTALAMPHDRERCLEAGMDEYISKPINLKGLVRMIQNCLFNSQEPASP